MVHGLAVFFFIIDCAFERGVKNSSERPDLVGNWH
jgi:hypothetical protein